MKQVLSENAPMILDGIELVTEGAARLTFIEDPNDVSRGNLPPQQFYVTERTAQLMADKYWGKKLLIVREIMEWTEGEAGK